MNDYELKALAKIAEVRKRLREITDKPGMTDRNVAAFTGVHYSSLSRFRSGKSITADAFCLSGSGFRIRIDGNQNTRTNRLDA